MLAYVLAIAVGLSSLVLFLTAFSNSDIHRQDDFLWSGVGFFYALVLWFCASRITGSVLLGQVAVVTLVISLSWQNLKLRKAIANPEEQVDLESFSITELISGLWKDSRPTKPQSSTAQTIGEEQTRGVTLAEAVKSLEEEVEEVAESGAINSEPLATATDAEIDELSDSESDSTTTKPEKKGLSFGQIFNFGNKESSVVSKTEDNPYSPLTSTAADTTTESVEPETDNVESQESVSTKEIEEETIKETLLDSAESEQETISPEEVITTPTVEPIEESTSTSEFTQSESYRTDSVETAVPEKEIEEIEVVVPLTETTPETDSELNVDSQVEEIRVDIEDLNVRAENLIDVEFIPSEIEEETALESTDSSEEKSKSSIDDFLADLDKNIDKPSRDNS